MAWMATIAFTVQNPPVRIDWSDGTVEQWDTSPATHLYTAGGWPTVVLTDTVHGKSVSTTLVCPTWNTVRAGSGYPTWNAVMAANPTWNDVLSRRST